jgi:hypothetical protein
LKKNKKIKPILDYNTVDTIDNDSLFSITINSSTSSSSNLCSIDEKYYKIIQDIRNLQTLNEEQINYIKNLPKQMLIDIIKLYNYDIEVIQEYTKNM